MRHVDRHGFSSLRAKELDPLLVRAAEATRRLLVQSAKDTPEFRPEVWRAFKPLLHDLFLGKCAYCEAKIGVGSFGELENFRPKSLYPWLAYEWTNLLLACQVCNRYKAARFPVEGQSVTSPVDDLNLERPLLLDPTVDLPEEHLVFTAHASSQAVTAEGLSERGRTTIMVLGLNRESLVSARSERWMSLLRVLEMVASPARRSKELLSFLHECLSDSAEHAAAVRQLAGRWLEDHGTPSLTNLIDPERSTTPKTTARQRQGARKKTAAMKASLGAYSVEDASNEAHRKFAFVAKRIERIEVRNLRALRDVDLLVPDSGENESWVMVIGENGVGKSSLLQGVALALMGQVRTNARGLNAAEFVRRGAKQGFVRVHVSGIGPVELKFRKGSRKFKIEPPDPKIPLLGYGSTRLLPRDTGHPPLDDRNIRIENLFNPTVPLCDADKWLKRLYREDRKAFADIGRAICRLLMLSDRPAPRFENGIVTVKTPDGWRPIRQLSDGYQSMIALIVDIAIGATGTRRSPEDVEGIVILDEIETHLHPQWKISIVERFRQCFPKLNFLVTTHDPLCLKGLRDNEILILRRDAPGKVAYVSVPSVHQMKTDDILMSDLFELPSGRNAAFSLTLARYSVLLNKARRSAKEELEMKQLREGISTVLSGALTPMQRQVSRVMMVVLKHLRNGKGGRALTRDVIAEIGHQVSQIGKNA
jgi:uncharacterized protein (TIGR02646 family)